MFDQTTAHKFGERPVRLIDLRIKADGAIRAVVRSRESNPQQWVDVENKVHEVAASAFAAFTVKVEIGSYGVFSTRPSGWPVPYEQPMIRVFGDENPFNHNPATSEENYQEVVYKSKARSGGSYVGITGTIANGVLVLVLSNFATYVLNMGAIEPGRAMYYHLVLGLPAGQKGTVTINGTPLESH